MRRASRWAWKEEQGRVPSSLPVGSKMTRVESRVPAELPETVAWPCAARAGPPAGHSLAPSGTGAARPAENLLRAIAIQAYSKLSCSPIVHTSRPPPCSEFQAPCFPAIYALAVRIAMHACKLPLTRTNALRHRGSVAAAHASLPSSDC